MRVANAVGESPQLEMSNDGFGVATRFVPCCSDSFFELGNLEMMAMPLGPVAGEEHIVLSCMSRGSGVSVRLGCMMG